jgi:hypothetical protein
LKRGSLLSRRSLACIALGSGLLALAAYRTLADPPRGEQDERVPADESLHIAGIIASAVERVENLRRLGEATPRDQHAKAHGCVRARAEVGEVPPAMRYGVLAQPRSYPAWIRFSNGDARRRPDRVQDARGFALKLMGVPGTKLLPDEADEETQDFVMINRPFFFIRTAADYAAFVRALGEGRRFGFFLGGGSPDPRRWRLRELALALRTPSPAPRSPLDTWYYSVTAYKLGPDLNVKYAARPCLPRGPGRRGSGDDFLREALRADLEAGDGCFDLLVQPQVPGRNMPVEDTTVLWRESDSPFVPVARVRIPRQTFDTPEQNAFCEDLSFTPWHALPEHRPVGVMNRLREAVYREVSRYRHAKNGTPRREPRGHCLDLAGSPCPETPQ